jgi:hypothetical protein
MNLRLKFLRKWALVQKALVGRFTVSKYCNSWGRDLSSFKNPSLQRQIDRYERCARLHWVALVSRHIPIGDNLLWEVRCAFKRVTCLPRACVLPRCARPVNSYAFDILQDLTRQCLWSLKITGSVNSI